MGKKSASSKKRRRDEAWTGADHINRKLNKSAKKASMADNESSTNYRERRSAALSHNTEEKKDMKKLQLHITKTKRELEALRERLECWDDVEEKEREASEEKQREEEALRQQEEEDIFLGRKKKKRRKRPGPETWKLRGAARPAWEVYDFDTRYVDPHQKAHDEANAKAKRSRNLLVVYKGDFASQDAPVVCRSFLSLLMRMGLLCLQAKKHKAARGHFLECMRLDSASQPITTARCRLMRLYLEANRPDSARRLWERLPQDKSVWIRYSAALVEYVSWDVLHEEGSTRLSAERTLAGAIRANVFCAYYLAFHETFQGVMEYTDEIEDATDGEPLEEAIEYCSSEQLGAWAETNGAIPWIRTVILRAVQGRNSVAGGLLRRADLEWKEKLKKLEDEVPAQEQQEEDGENADDPEELVDVGMFAGMFRTAMEMLQEEGALNESVEEPRYEEQTDSVDLEETVEEGNGDSDSDE